MLLAAVLTTQIVRCEALLPEQSLNIFEYCPMCYVAFACRTQPETLCRSFDMVQRDSEPGEAGFATSSSQGVQKGMSNPRDCSCFLKYLKVSSAKRARKKTCTSDRHKKSWWSGCLRLPQNSVFASGSMLRIAGKQNI